MSVNPYQPTTAVTLPASTGSLGKTIAKFAAAIYGCVYVAFCTFSAVEDIQDERAAAWIAINATFDVLTAYGIFAMVLPIIRSGRLCPAWRVFAWALPIYLITSTFWELTTDPQPLPAIAYAIAVPLLMVFVAPAIALNFMLCNRLRASTRVIT